MKEKVDVLVVGLGPAGGAEALAAAQAGLRVAAVERRKEIGVPVQCAEFIPLPLARYAVPEGVLQQRIQGMVSHLPSGSIGIYTTCAHDESCWKSANLANCFRSSSV